MRKKATTRTLAGAMAFVVFTTNAALAHAPEANFWAERRKRVQGQGAKAPAAPLLVAGLPAAPDAASARAFLSRLPALERPTLAPALAGSVRENLPRGFTEKNAALLQALPYAFGGVRKISLPAPAADSGSVVVHIQDVHQNAEAQRNIGGAVQALVDQDQVGLVALEGAFAPMDFSGLRAFSRQDILRKAADYLLRIHGISGPVHAALTGPKAFPALAGVDDAGHHAANVEAYRRSAPLMEEQKERTSHLRAGLERRKDERFSPALRAFDRAAQSHRIGQSSLGEYVKTLASAAPAGAAGPALRAFQEALALEAVLDFKRVEDERMRIVERLVQKLDKDQIGALTQWSAAYRLGQVSYADFYKTLQGLCRRSGLDLARYPAMESYIRYVLLADRIDADRLFAEISVLEKAAYRALARTPEEKHLVEESRALGLAEKLLDFSLTPEEWRDYLLNEKIIPGLASFEDFYKQAQARDQAMADNLLAAMAARHARAAVLVAGGYHSAGLAERLTRAGVTVVTFAPKIEKLDAAQGSAYLSVFTREKAPLEKLFQGQKLFLASPPGREAENTLPSLLIPGSVHFHNAAKPGDSMAPRKIRETMGAASEELRRLGCLPADVGPLQGEAKGGQVTVKLERGSLLIRLVTYFRNGEYEDHRSTQVPSILSGLARRAAVVAVGLVTGGLAAAVALAKEEAEFSSIALRPIVAVAREMEFSSVVLRPIVAVTEKPAFTAVAQRGEPSVVQDLFSGQLGTVEPLLNEWRSFLGTMDTGIEAIAVAAALILFFWILKTAWSRWQSRRSRVLIVLAVAAVAIVAGAYGGAFFPPDPYPSAAAMGLDVFSPLSDGAPQISWIDRAWAAFSGFSKDAWERGVPVGLWSIVAVGAWSVWKKRAQGSLLEFVVFMTFSGALLASRGLAGPVVFERLLWGLLGVVLGLGVLSRLGWKNVGYTAAKGSLGHLLGAYLTTWGLGPFHEFFHYAALDFLSGLGQFHDDFTRLPGPEGGGYRLAQVMRLFLPENAMDWMMYLERSEGILVKVAPYPFIWAAALLVWKFRRRSPPGTLRRAFWGGMAGATILISFSVGVLQPGGDFSDAGVRPRYFGVAGVLVFGLYRLSAFVAGKAWGRIAKMALVRKLNTYLDQVLSGPKRILDDALSRAQAEVAAADAAVRYVWARRPSLPSMERFLRRWKARRPEATPRALRRPSRAGSTVASASVAKPAAPPRIGRTGRLPARPARGAWRMPAFLGLALSGGVGYIVLSVGAAQLWGLYLSVLAVFALFSFTALPPFLWLSRYLQAHGPGRAWPRATGATWYAGLFMGLAVSLAFWRVDLYLIFVLFPALLARELIVRRWPPSRAREVSRIPSSRAGNNASGTAVNRRFGMSKVVKNVGLLKGPAALAGGLVLRGRIAALWNWGKNILSLAKETEILPSVDWASAGAWLISMDWRLGGMVALMLTGVILGGLTVWAIGEMRKGWSSTKNSFPSPSGRAPRGGPALQLSGKGLDVHGFEWDGIPFQLKTHDLHNQAVRELVPVSAAPEDLSSLDLDKADRDAIASLGPWTRDVRIYCLPDLRNLYARKILRSLLDQWKDAGRDEDMAPMGFFVKTAADLARDILLHPGTGGGDSAQPGIYMDLRAKDILKNLPSRARGRIFFHEFVHLKMRLDSEDGLHPSEKVVREQDRALAAGWEMMTLEEAEAALRPVMEAAVPPLSHKDSLENPESDSLVRMAFVHAIKKRAESDGRARGEDAWTLERIGQLLGIHQSMASEDYRRAKNLAGKSPFEARLTEEQKSLLARAIAVVDRYETAVKQIDERTKKEEGPVQASEEERRRALDSALRQMQELLSSLRTKRALPSDAEKIRYPDLQNWITVRSLLLRSLVLTLQEGPYRWDDPRIARLLDLDSGAVSALATQARQASGKPGRRVAPAELSSQALSLAKEADGFYNSKEKEKYLEAVEKLRTLISYRKIKEISSSAWPPVARAVSVAARAAGTGAAVILVILAGGSSAFAGDVLFQALAPALDAGAGGLLHASPWAGYAGMGLGVGLFFSRIAFRGGLRLRGTGSSARKPAGESPAAPQGASAEARVIALAASAARRDPEALLRSFLGNDPGLDKRLRDFGGAGVPGVIASFRDRLEDPSTARPALDLLRQALESAGVPAGEVFPRLLAGQGVDVAALRGIFEGRPRTVFVPHEAVEQGRLAAFLAVSRLFNSTGLVLVVEERDTGALARLQQEVGEASRLRHASVPDQSYRPDQTTGRTILVIEERGGWEAQLPLDEEPLAFGPLSLVAPEGTALARYNGQIKDLLAGLLPLTARLVGTILDLQKIVAVLTAA